MTTYFHKNAIIQLFRNIYYDQRNEKGELLVSYAISLLMEMSKHDLPRFIKFLEDMEIECDLKDIQEWWEEEE